jgi:hypothetical protein
MDNNNNEGFVPTTESLPKTDTAIPLDLWGDWSISGRPELTSDMVPAIIWEFSSDEAKRIGTTPGAIAVSCLVAVSCAIRFGWRVQPQRLNWRWKERPIIWAAVTGNPSDKKTPAVMSAIDALSEIEVEWIKEDAPIFEKYESDERVYKTKLSRYESERAKSDTADEDDSGRPAAPSRPPRRRLIIRDTTIERVCEILEDNPAGCMIDRDELSGWYGSFDAYRTGGASKDRSFYLESFNGGRDTKDRVGNGIGKKTIVMENRAISVIGTIQNDKLKSVARKLDRDGFMARFVFASAANRLGADVEPNIVAYNGYKSMLKRITELEVDRSVEGYGDVKFSDEAITIHNEIIGFKNAVCGLSSIPEGLADHLGKWEGLFARFCLVFHMIDAATNGTDPRRVISGKTAEQVKKLFLCYLFQESMNIYSEVMGVPEEHENAKWIGGYILSRTLDKITAFDVERAFRTLRGDKEATRRAMDILELASWVKPDSKDGRNVKKWTVNPRVHEIFAERAEQERVRRLKEREEIAKGQETLRSIREQMTT